MTEFHPEEHNIGCANDGKQKLTTHDHPTSEKHQSSRVFQQAVFGAIGKPRSEIQRTFEEEETKIVKQPSQSRVYFLTLAVITSSRNN
jgi:hypothetical protein